MIDPRLGKSWTLTDAMCSPIIKFLGNGFRKSNSEEKSLLPEDENHCDQ